MNEYFDNGNVQTLTGMTGILTLLAILKNVLS